MPTIQSNQFRNIALNQPDSARVFLKQDTLSSGTGVIQWIKGRVLASHNRRVAEAFIDSIRNDYGAEIATHVSQTADLNRALEKGKPLKSRHVTSALELADHLKVDFHEANKKSVENIQRPYTTSSDISPLQVQIDSAAKKYFGDDCELESVRKLVDVKKFSENLADDIEFKGDDDTHLVTTDEAARLSKDNVRWQLLYGETANQQQRVGTLEQDGSIAQESLKKASAQAGIHLEISKLAPEALKGLNTKIVDKVGTTVTESFKHIDDGKTDKKLPALVNDEKLQAIADKITRQFINERLEAYQQVQAIPKTGLATDAAESEAIHDKLSEIALHTNIDPVFIEPLANGHSKMTDSFAQLNTALTPGNTRPQRDQALQATQHLSNALVDASAARLIAPDEREETLPLLWRFALAGTSTETKSQLAERLPQPNGTFEKLVHALEAIRNNLPDTEEFQDEPEKYHPVFAQASAHGLFLRDLPKELSSQTNTGSELREAPDTELLTEEQADLLRKTFDIQTPEFLIQDEDETFNKTFDL